MTSQEDAFGLEVNLSEGSKSGEEVPLSEGEFKLVVNLSQKLCLRTGDTMEPVGLGEATDVSGVVIKVRKGVGDQRSEQVFPFIDVLKFHETVLLYGRQDGGGTYFVDGPEGQEAKVPRHVMLGIWPYVDYWNTQSYIRELKEAITSSARPDRTVSSKVA